MDNIKMDLRYIAARAALLPNLVISNGLWKVIRSVKFPMHPQWTLC
jgi:hypothetical protein